MRTTLTLIVAVLVVGACSSDTSGPSQNQTTVNVNDDSFAPGALTVTTGATVTWDWKGGNPHNVTWVGAGAPAASATQTTGTYQRTFSAAGTYDYYCTVHGTPTSGMRGSVTVP